MSEKAPKAAARDMKSGLTYWQERYRLSEAAYADEKERMQRREDIVDGSHVIMTPDGTAAKKKATHVRNVAFEVVESQVDSNIPQPKVTAVREEDEPLAKIAEDMLRNLLDRLPMERINDEAERITPTQGGMALLLEWFSQASGRGWMGDLKLTLLHPRKVVPQEGIDQVADMDYLFVDEYVTKKQVKRRFGVDVSNENEEDPELRGAGASSTSDELVTLHTAYYRNDKGGVGRFRWVNDVVCEDLEDYQTRRVQVCAKCGAVGDGIQCRYCGSKRFTEELQEYEELTEDLTTAMGTVIPAMSQERDEDGQPVFREVGQEALMEPMGGGDLLMDQMAPAGAMPVGVYRVRQEPVMGPTKLPYYKPDVFPVVLRKNVSKSGRFLGGSDIDAIEDQQNTLNKLSTKINRKVLGGGSIITKKKSMNLTVTDEDNVVVDVDGPADIECFQVRNTQVDISSDLVLRGEIYEEARQVIGITDSFQGRKDSTATSGKAKEFAAAQTAGRLESKRTMKNAQYQDLFELMFKFILAYCDEPRPVVAYNEQGQKEYKLFDRHDFLYQDEAGNWKYNTDFLFSCDTSAPLASNREAMWQETRMNFQQGAFGQPTELATLVRFWTIMEQLHYPTAAQMKKDLQTELEQQREQQAQLMAMQKGMTGAGQQSGMETANTGAETSFGGAGANEV